MHKCGGAGVIIAWIAVVNVARRTINIGKQRGSQSQRNQRNFENLPRFLVFLFSGEDGGLLPIKEWLQVFKHVVRQSGEDGAAAPILLQGERGEQNREWWKVFRESFPTRVHQ